MLSKESALQRKSHLCIPFLGIAIPRTIFHISLSVCDLFIPRIGPHISCSWIGRSMVGIYKSLTDTRRWKFGQWLPRKFVLNFWYWFFAVWSLFLNPHRCGDLAAKWGVVSLGWPIASMHCIWEIYLGEKNIKQGVYQFMNQPQKSFGDLTLYIKSMTIRAVYSSRAWLEM